MPDVSREHREGRRDRPLNRVHPMSDMKAMMTVSVSVHYIEGATVNRRIDQHLEVHAGPLAASVRRFAVRS